MRRSLTPNFFRTEQHHPAKLRDRITLASLTMLPAPFRSSETRHEKSQTKLLHSNERQNHSSAIMLGGGTVSLLKQVRRPFGVTCNWNGDGHNVVSVHCLGEGVPSYCGSAWMVSP